MPRPFTSYLLNRALRMFFIIHPGKVSGYRVYQLTIAGEVKCLTVMSHTVFLINNPYAEVNTLGIYFDPFLVHYLIKLTHCNLDFVSPPINYAGTGL